MSGCPPTVERDRRRWAWWSTRSRLLRDQRGATAVEYGLIVGLIVIAMIASFQNLANTTVGMWGNVDTKIANATGN